MEVAVGLASDPERAVRVSPRFRRTLFFTALAVGLLAALVLAWTSVGTGKQSDDRATREDVMSLASQFMLRKETFGPDDLDSSAHLTDYQKRVHELISAKLAASFDKDLPAAEALVAKQGLSSAAKVYATGVSTLDADTATVLVTGATSYSYTEGQSGQAVFRTTVTLVRIDGAWKVDGFAELPAGGAA